MKKITRIFNKFSPAKINKNLQAKKKISKIKKTINTQQKWKKLTPEERLSLVQKAIKDTALEHIAAENISALSSGKEKKIWKEKSQQIKKQERFLRTLAIKCHKEIKNNIK